MSTQTAAELLALPDDELSKIAATEIHGWRLSGQYWFGPDTEIVSIKGEYRPATNRNQSGELLQTIAKTGRDAVFGVWVGTKLNEIDVSVGFGHSITVSGNNAKSETVAAILANRAIKGANKQ